MKRREATRHIQERSRNDPSFGAEKLDLLLFHADFRAHRLLGRSITGATYRRTPTGPSPREREEQTEPSALTEEEMKILDETIREFREMTPEETGERARGEWGYRTTRDGEDIPYYTTWVSSAPLTPEQIRKGQEIARSAGPTEA